MHLQGHKNCYKNSYFITIYHKSIFFQKQIQETHAKQLCHEFKDMKKKQREKISEANNDLNKENDDLEKKTTKLSKYVADAATGLCRKMLRYRGKQSF